MKTDNRKTKVKFLYNEPNKDLFAYFPDERQGDITIRLSYSIVGQHSPCSIAYANESKPATPEQYAPLKAELDSIGYNLEILN